MELTNRLLCIYRDCVKSGFDVELNLWSSGGEEFFSFHKNQELSSKQSKTSKRNLRRRKNRNRTGAVTGTGSSRAETVAGSGSSIARTVAGSCSYARAVSGSGSSTAGAITGAGSTTVGAVTGAGFSTAGAAACSSWVRVGSSKVGADTGAGSPRDGTPTGADSPRDEASSLSIRAGSPRDGYVAVSRMKTRSRSRQDELPLPQLDGSCPSPPPPPQLDGTHSSPSVIPTLDQTNPNPVPPTSVSMFGYCKSNNCSICPKRTTDKFGGYYACFGLADPGKQCSVLHAHSRTNLCSNPLLPTEIILKM